MRPNCSSINTLEQNRTSPLLFGLPAWFRVPPKQIARVPDLLGIISKSAGSCNMAPPPEAHLEIVIATVAWNIGTSMTGPFPPIAIGNRRTSFQPLCCRILYLHFHNVRRLWHVALLVQMAPDCVTSGRIRCYWNHIVLQYAGSSPVERSPSPVTTGPHCRSCPCYRRTPSVCRVVMARVEVLLLLPVVRA